MWTTRVSLWTCDEGGKGEYPYLSAAGFCLFSLGGKNALILRFLMAASSFFCLFCFMPCVFDEEREVFFASTFVLGFVWEIILCKNPFMSGNLDGFLILL